MTQADAIIQVSAVAAAAATSLLGTADNEDYWPRLLLRLDVSVEIVHEPRLRRSANHQRIPRQVVLDVSAQNFEQSLLFGLHLELRKQLGKQAGESLVGARQPDVRVDSD